ncbi:MAG: hypothetical protein JJU29_12255 [Verrucomicrobia bacterium]|nr:hypothetical protein [Verrucomicrobiota bacterium]MCH8513133.1 hypothetical protein [Kiritimatiellia bacterium]
MKAILNLQVAIDKKDGNAVEDALILCYDKEGGEDYVGLLVQLLLANWHMMHEDVALELQRLRSPLAVPALRVTATRKFQYLEYNGSHALARKCTWALADIGTKESKDKLIEITACEDPEVAGCAQKRLTNWESELGRKGAE